MLCLVAIVVCAAALGAPRVRWAEVGVSAAVALVAGVAAVRHLLAASAPLLDLRLFAIPTFRTTNTAGTLNRVAINAVPFLLPLLFQVGFGWTPVKSGEVVLALFAGNLAIKPATTPLLRRFGFRTLIVAANLVATATIVGCGLITRSTPLVAILALLAISGAARSVGFTAYNTIAFADVEAQSMGDANTIIWTVFQVSIAVGVALAAVGVRIGAWSASTLGGGSPTPAYRTAFLILALFTPRLLRGGASDAARRGRRVADGDGVADGGGGAAPLPGELRHRQAGTQRVDVALGQPRGHLGPDRVAVEAVRRSARVGGANRRVGAGEEASFMKRG